MCGAMATPTGQYFYHLLLPEQPDLNWSSPGLRQAMYDVAPFWLRRGASGFRLDATPYIFEDPAFPQDPDPAAGLPYLKPYNSARPENHAVLRELRQVLEFFPRGPRSPRRIYHGHDRGPRCGLRKEQRRDPAPDGFLLRQSDDAQRRHFQKGHRRLATNCAGELRPGQRLR
jgi:alpha-glucosidase